MERMIDETFAEYKARRAAAKQATKEALKPKMFHDSHTFGTYVNNEKRAAKADRQLRKLSKTQGKNV